MPKEIELKDGDGVYINVPYHGGYLIAHDPTWGIVITPLGASTIPKCAALAERPDLCKRQLDSEPHPA